MLVNVINIHGKPVIQIGNPIKFASGHYFAQKTGTSLGYNPHEILSSLGYSTKDIDDLKSNHVI